MDDAILVVSDDEGSSTTDTSSEGSEVTTDTDVRSALLATHSTDDGDDGLESIREELKDAVRGDTAGPGTAASTWADMLFALDETVSKKAKRRKKRKSFCKNNIPPPVLALGRKGATAVKIVAKKSGGTRRPTVMATFRRVPPPSSSGAVLAKGGGGFARKKVLVDTGATRTAITSDIANSILKLRAQGSTDVTTGDGVTAKRTLVRICVEVDSTVVHVWATVRPPTALKHCILGIDWVGTVCPQWVYEDKKRRRVQSVRKHSTGNLPSVPMLKARKRSVQGRKRGNSAA